MKKNMKKNMLWMLLSLMAAAIMMPLSATAQTRIAVVSDIHVMDPSLLPEEKGEGTPWDTYYKGQRKMLEQSAGLFDQFINAMKSEAPDVLLITGDLTKDGEEASHQYVIDKLAELKTYLNNKNKNIKIYVIPGNHDFGEETDPLDPTKDADKLSTSFDLFYADYGYSGSTPDTEGNSLSYVAEPVSGLVLLAIDSHSGSIDPATLTWICNQALSARANGKRVIAMMHHPLFPHITGAELFATSYTVANYTTVRNALINAGVNVILTGHFHTSDIAYDWDDDATVINNGIYDINTGSLISYPCDYRMLTLSADKSKLGVNTYSMTETSDLQPIESDNKVTWKDWLQGRMAKKAKDVITEYEEPIKSFIANFAAKAYVIHAEGNENISTDINRSMILSAANSFPNYTPIFNSMLNDISNYENGSFNNNHENQTNDRTLTINLDSPSSLLLELDNNVDNNSIINYYHGKTATVTLTGRTLLKDGAWNTICLPFDVTDGDADDSNVATGGTDGKTFTDTQLFDAVAKPLTSASITEDKGITTLNLEFGAAVTTIEAGRPYIIKWANTNETITDPKFTGVTINKTPHIDGNENVITFRGTYAWQRFTDENKKILLIGKYNDKSVLYYPQPALTNPNQEFNADTNPWIYPSLGACRAYFQLADGYTAGESIEGGGGTIRNFVLNFGNDDSATGIIAIGDSQSSTLNAQRSEWFTLDGRRLAAKPTAKGLYIHAGRKVVIK